MGEEALKYSTERVGDFAVGGKKKKGPSKLDGKKARAAKQKGIVPIIEKEIVVPISKIEVDEQLKKELEKAAHLWGDLTDQAAEIHDEKKRKEILRHIDERCAHLRLAERFDAGEESNALLLDYNELIVDLEKKLQEAEIEAQKVKIEDSVEKVSFAEFRKKYKDVYRANRFRADGKAWMIVRGYDETDGKARVTNGVAGKNGRNNLLSLAELDELLQEYPQAEEIVKKPIIEPKIESKAEPVVEPIAESATEPIVDSETKEKTETENEREKEKAEELEFLEKLGKEFWGKFSDDNIWGDYDTMEKELILKTETAVMLKKLIKKSEFFQGQENEVSKIILQKIINREV